MWSGSWSWVVTDPLRRAHPRSGAMRSPAMAYSPTCGQTHTHAPRAQSPDPAQPSGSPLAEEGGGDWGADRGPRGLRGATSPPRTPVEPPGMYRLRNVESLAAGACCRGPPVCAVHAVASLAGLAPGPCSSPQRQHAPQEGDRAAAVPPQQDGQEAHEREHPTAAGPPCGTLPLGYWQGTRRAQTALRRSHPTRTRPELGGGRRQPHARGGPGRSSEQQEVSGVGSDVATPVRGGAAGQGGAPCLRQGASGDGAEESRDCPGRGDALPDQGPAQQGGSLDVSCAERLRGTLGGGHQMGAGARSSCCGWRALQPERSPRDPLRDGGTPWECDLRERKPGTCSDCSPKCECLEGGGRYQQRGQWR
eukprot:jgi/Botrbrau1/4433/Bobra.0348s0022.1